MRRSVFVLGSGLAALLALAAVAAEPAPAPGDGSNYLIPVPPDLPGRQLDAKKREDATYKAEAAEAKAAQENIRAQQHAAPAQNPNQPIVEPLPGFMYK